MMMIWVESSAPRQTATSAEQKHREEQVRGDMERNVRQTLTDIPGHP